MSRPAARLTDMHVCPMFTGPVPHVGGPILPPCAPTVLIAALPAARVTDLAFCAGPPDVIVVGAFTTLIQGLPAARMGDQCAHGGTIVVGCPTVLIGDSGSAGSPQAGTMSAARESAAAFTMMDCNRAAAVAAAAENPTYQAAQAPPATDQETGWIEAELVDEQGEPISYQHCRVTTPDGTVREGWTDAKGLLRLEGIKPGQCKITFPELDAEAWTGAGQSGAG
jgi:uncharacterized Zn-binding protein involved in type VI secretion